MKIKKDIKYILLALLILFGAFFLGVWMAFSVGHNFAVAARYEIHCEDKMEHRI